MSEVLAISLVILTATGVFINVDKVLQFVTALFKIELNLEKNECIVSRNKYLTFCRGKHFNYILIQINQFSLESWSISGQQQNYIVTDRFTVSWRSYSGPWNETGVRV